MADVTSAQKLALVTDCCQILAFRFPFWLNFLFKYPSPLLPYTPHLLSSPLTSPLLSFLPSLFPVIASPLLSHSLFLLPKQTSLETELLPRKLKTGQVLFHDVEINDCSPKERKEGELERSDMKDRR